MAAQDDRSLTYKWLVGILTAVVFALVAGLWHNLSNQVYFNSTTLSANVTAVATLTESVKILAEQVRELRADVKEIKTDIKSLSAN